MKRLTDTEVADLLKSERRWNIARRIFSVNTANISRYENLRPLELRRMEFEAVAEIAEALGIMLPGMGDLDPARTVPGDPGGFREWAGEPPAEPEAPPAPASGKGVP